MEYSIGDTVLYVSSVDEKNVVINARKISMITYFKDKRIYTLDEGVETSEVYKKLSDIVDDYTFYEAFLIYPEALRFLFAKLPFVQPSTPKIGERMFFIDVSNEDHIALGCDKIIGIEETLTQQKTIFKENKADYVFKTFKAALRYTVSLKPLCRLIRIPNDNTYKNLSDFLRSKTND